MPDAKYNQVWYTPSYFTSGNRSQAWGDMSGGKAYGDWFKQMNDYAIQQQFSPFGPVTGLPEDFGRLSPVNIGGFKPAGRVLSDPNSEWSFGDPTMQEQLATARRNELQDIQRTAVGQTNMQQYGMGQLSQRGMGMKPTENYGSLFRRMM